MIPEIRLLINNLEGHKWYETTQSNYYKLLIEEDFFHSTENESSNPAFSARDRVNRGPQMLGFINLRPEITLTQAGKKFLYSSRPEEALLRQMLKYQLPSPYQKASKALGDIFWCKPYLELLRLIRYFGSVTFDEIKIFGIQLTDYRSFDLIIEKIEKFRMEKAITKETYVQFSGKVFDSETRSIYRSELSNKNYSVRESCEFSEKKYLSTKKQNARDYTDALFRYFAMTGLTAVSQSGHSIGIAHDRIEDVDFILDSVDRDPVFVDDLEKYQNWLFDPTTPSLSTDNEETLQLKIKNIDENFCTSGMDISTLKNAYDSLRTLRKEQLLNNKILVIKDMKEYFDIVEVFDRIKRKEYYDNPLMFEWNTWRAMTMIDGGRINANLNFDDYGNPLSTAAGNKADIECDYGDFILNVEVTLQSGQKQYDNEGEPVARHIGKAKSKWNKEVFCLFVAPRVSDATIAHFYYLQNINIRHYGGKALIIPVSLSTFVKMIQDSYKASYKPEPFHIMKLINRIEALKDQVCDEIEWYEKVQIEVASWLRD
ncbi:AlwI family type II restriction endonuclease [Gordonibacter sp.]|nr:AlwI family type II restriction endonuclease [Gordonibacter sp.]